MVKWLLVLITLLVTAMDPFQKPLLSACYVPIPLQLTPKSLLHARGVQAGRILSPPVVVAKEDHLSYGRVVGDLLLHLLGFWAP